MKKREMIAIVVLALGLMMHAATVSNAAPMGTAWTYQGRLMDANGPADGLYDFEFKLYPDPNSGGFQIAPKAVVNNHDVIDGYFTVELDFGQYAFNGYARWLEVAVRPGDSNDVHAILSPRQQVTPTPYAIRAHIADSSADGVTGSGTTNRLAKFTATKVVSDSAIYESGGKVGIGTTSPESRLHVNQTVGAWGEGIRLSYGDHDWDLVTDTSGERLLIAQDQIINRGLAIKNGDVGIGEASPLTTLHVQGTDRALPNDALSGDDIIAEDWTATLGLYSDDRASYGSCITLGEFVGDTGTLTNKWGIYRMTGPSSALRFSFGTDQDFTANPTLLTITAGGSVGIGTTSPAAKLDVVGSNADALISATNNMDWFESCAVYGRSNAELGYGVHGENANGDGVYGESSNGFGVVGTSGTKYGVYGYSYHVGGVRGYSGNGDGVTGESNQGDGVYGESAFGYGVHGRSTTSYGVYGYSSESYAGCFGGDVWVEDNCSAESFTDRTPYPKDIGTAYEAVMSMGRLPDGQYDETNREAQLDHATLHDYIRSEDGHRDLSATVSCHNEVLKDLIRKQQDLGKAHTYIEQLQKQNQLLQARLVKLEAIVAQLNVSQEGEIK